MPSASASGMSHHRIASRLLRGLAAYLRCLTPSSRSVGALMCCLLLAQPPETVGAQERSEPDSGARGGQQTPPISPSSPRAALEGFLRLTRTGRYAEAARYLDAPRATAAESTALA